MRKKKEVILLKELATLEQFEEEKEQNVYPLGITLSSVQYSAYKTWREEKASKSFVESPDANLSIFAIINDMYSLITQADGEKGFMLNAYRLREKIANGEIFVNRFVDEDYQVKPVDYVSASYGHDMDAPRIVFLDRKTPRKILKKIDHYDPSTDTISKGTDLLVLSYQVASKI